MGCTTSIESAMELDPSKLVEGAKEAQEVKDKQEELVEMAVVVTLDEAKEAALDAAKEALAEQIDGAIDAAADAAKDAAKDLLKDNPLDKQLSATFGVSVNLGGFAGGLLGKAIDKQADSLKEGVADVIGNEADENVEPGQTHSGMLKKKSPNNIITPWQDRFIVLKENGLISYYGSKEEADSGVSAKGSFNVRGVTPTNRDSIFVSGSTKLNIIIGERMYEFEADSSDAAANWHAIILTHFK